MSNAGPGFDWYGGSRGALTESPIQAAAQTAAARSLHQEGEFAMRTSEKTHVKGLKGAGNTTLTEAEIDILQRVLAGRSNREIASERASSRRTVANQIATMFKKLGVRSRRELAARARAEAGDGQRGGALTSRERKVLLLVSEGCADKAIASDLGCSTSAVGALLTRARRKLDSLKQKAAPDQSA
jgi:DNA-binding CsgD family transcriptional regulator